jgi:hypothetical protein
LFPVYVKNKGNNNNETEPYKDILKSRLLFPRERDFRIISMPVFPFTFLFCFAYSMRHVIETSIIRILPSLIFL